MNESSLTPHDADHLADHAAIRTGSALVEITCPDWCQVRAEDHASGLWANEGRCVHEILLAVADPAGKQGWDQPPQYFSPIELALQMTTNPAGREVQSADVLINGQESSLDQVLLLAQAITDLAAMYRATPGRKS